MNLLLTGVDQELGKALYAGLATAHKVDGVGNALAVKDFSGNYRDVDFCDPEAATRAVEKADLIIHTQPYSVPSEMEEDAATVLLDQVTRSTYGLMKAACDADISRVVLISRLDIMQDYPESYIVQSDWAPKPCAEAASLTPYMAELVCREIARTSKIEVICLRLGLADIGVVTEAVEAAVNRKANASGHSWSLEHIGQRG
jgi:nucleoside-diphosphate-sugar epimerase